MPSLCRCLFLFSCSLTPLFLQLCLSEPDDPMTPLATSLDLDIDIFVSSSSNKLPLKTYIVSAVLTPQITLIHQQGPLFCSHLPDLIFVLLFSSPIVQKQTLSSFNVFKNITHRNLNSHFQFLTLIEGIMVPTAPTMSRHHIVPCCTNPNTQTVHQRAQALEEFSQNHEPTVWTAPFLSLQRWVCSGWVYRSENCHHQTRWQEPLKDRPVSSSKAEQLSVVTPTCREQKAGWQCPSSQDPLFWTLGLLEFNGFDFPLTLIL